MSEVVSSVAKGNALEDRVYEYLNAQIIRGEAVLGTHLADRCKLYRKKSYYCHIRNGNINFENVLEIYRDGSAEPQITLFFECKNYDKNVPETEITDFSNKLDRIAKHKSKGFIVTRSSLQRGAMNLCAKWGIGVIRFDPNGVDLKFLLERKSTFFEIKELLDKQFQTYNEYFKALKFSAHFDGRYFGSVHQLIHALTGGFEPDAAAHHEKIPFLSHQDIDALASSVLKEIGYGDGVVNLGQICQSLNLTLIYQNGRMRDDRGYEILGNADFQERKITIFSHENARRERFTTAHEIGHFVLQHDRFLNYESVTDNDLSAELQGENSISRLEYQANYFASCLILPTERFLQFLAYARHTLGIVKKGFGYIFVDDQPCNFMCYDLLIDSLCNEFYTSKSVVEIRLKQLNLLTDRRKQNWISASCHFANGSPISNTKMGV